jgi:hypothetical protein
MSARVGANEDEKDNADNPNNPDNQDNQGKGQEGKKQEPWFWAKYKLGTRALAGLNVVGLGLGVLVAVGLGALCIIAEAILKISFSILTTGALTLIGLLGAVVSAVTMAVDKIRKTETRLIDGRTAGRLVKDALALAVVGFIGVVTLGLLVDMNKNEEGNIMEKNRRNIAAGGFSQFDFTVNSLYKSSGALTLARAFIVGGHVKMPEINPETGLPKVGADAQSFFMSEHDVQGLIPLMRREAAIFQNVNSPPPDREFIIKLPQ